MEAKWRSAKLRLGGDTEPAMSQNVEIVSSAVKALGRGDFDGAFAAADPEIEWEEMPSLGPDAAVYRGVARAKEAVESWRGMWTDYESERRNWWRQGMM